MQILNNLAYVCWQRAKELSASKTEVPEEEMEAAKNDEKFVISWFKEAIQKREMTSAEEIDVANMQMLETLVTAEVAPDDMGEKYFEVLNSSDHSVLLSNLAEYLLE